MSVIAIPKPLRDKLGDEATEAFTDIVREIDFEARKDAIDIVEERFERRLTEETAKTNERISSLEVRMAEEFRKVNERISFEVGKVNERIASLEVKMAEEFAKVNERISSEIGKTNERISNLDGRLKLYFLAILFAIILVSPRAMDLIARLLGVVK
jgi:hypothetical protein